MDCPICSRPLEYVKMIGTDRFLACPSTEHGFIIKLSMLREYEEYLKSEEYQKSERRKWCGLLDLDYRDSEGYREYLIAKR